MKQLTKQEILQLPPKTKAYIKLSRIWGPEINPVVAEGWGTLSVQPADSKNRGRRFIYQDLDIGWAEGTEAYMDDSGDLVVENYVAQFFVEN